MANVCSFDLKVIGIYKDVYDFCMCLLGDENFEDEQMPTRCYDGTYCYDFETVPPEKAEACITGSCAWSVKSAFIDYSEPDSKNQILAFSKAHSLTMEFYSEEGGMEFAEHYIVESGEITTQEVVRFQEYYIEDVEENIEDFLNNPFVKECGITKENYLERFDGEEWLRLGGFGNAEFTI